jgi:S1-C subfamily serine protease
MAETRSRRSLVLLFLVAAGCASEDALDPFVTPAEQEASFSPFARETVQGESLRDFVAARTVELFDYVHDEGPGWKRTTASDFATAAAITTDGYWITAAHCLHGHTNVFLRTKKTGTFEREPARVVWTGRSGSDAGDDGGWRDLAVLKTEKSPGVAFECLGADAIAPGTSLVSVGFPRLIPSAVPSDAPSFAGGHLDERSEPEPFPQGPETVLLREDARLRPGYSGGPLSTLDGRLVAVNIRVLLLPTGRWKTIAVAPDWSWIRACIDADRARSQR